MILTIEQYLKENIDDHITISQWPNKNMLPIFIRNLYNIYEMKILDIPCILVEIRDETPTIDVIKKHIKRIKELANKEIILYYKEITRYRRKSFIENRIPFIIEGGQIFLPFLGLDLKRTTEYFDERSTSFTTSTQLAYLYFLYNKDVVVNTTEFARRMNFTEMTASRALNYLYDAKLLRYKVGGMTGRSKEYHRIPDPEYFEIGKAYVKSPIKKVVYVEKAPVDALIAGLDALAQLSMINPPTHPIRAISHSQFNKQDYKIVKNKDMIKEQHLVELELWHYDPKLFTNKKHVDLMSLYCSLKENKDERVEQALGEVLRGETWYTG